ncbi:hypothetical protein PHYC_02201 [Phycisphaerales bacterium]|nr:hypothetical protein PHYC_02201 [Phycisphaerales bacterium]
MSDLPLDPQARYLPLPVVQRWLSVCRRTLYRMLKRGEITGIYVGRARRIDRASLEAFIARGGSRRAS